MGQVKIQIAKAGNSPAHAALLSGAERARLQAMTPENRPAFMTARGLLRIALGRQLAMKPEDVPLLQEGAGRVTLGCRGAQSPSFSVSHTQSGMCGFVAVAVSDAAPIGVDIEATDRQFDWRRLASRRLSETEQVWFSKCSDKEGREAFLKLWTLKEALVKLWDDKLLRVLAETSLDLGALSKCRKGAALLHPSVLVPLVQPKLPPGAGVSLCSGEITKPQLYLGLAIQADKELDIDIEYL
ncbi:hypothetical protein GCM10017044_11040 [Kordiimonas sediminis]|uniref:4'-phosphopantetheinyl transferase domain-containing protein n=1 Tax=Kordiimonas sediminis TaxID=1735581 RepID=A0A919AP57_9PROT|nr:4'-phosphopantetheinyl transferase superfamily protein [Kordiimonas sediminis]GHF18312.1 hypothetical protein GCM10017044_11040 [Kordiimonas sediminis]